MNEARTASITVTVNGTLCQRSVEPRVLLSDFLRHDLALTGTHVGCEHGVCGACTVLLDGEPVRSCLMLAVQADGHAITTVEGLSTNGYLHPIQQAFHETHALQCGFCTPGVLMTVVALLHDHPDVGEHAVREGLSGNLCRCTGYQAMVDAVLLALARDASAPGPALRVWSVNAFFATRTPGSSPGARCSWTTSTCRGCSTSRFCGATMRTPACVA